MPTSSTLDSSSVGLARRLRRAGPICVDPTTGVTSIGPVGENPAQRRRRTPTPCIS